MTPRQGRSAVPSTTVKAEVRGRKDIGMAGAQTGARERKVALAGAGTGG